MRLPLLLFVLLFPLAAVAQPSFRLPPTDSLAFTLSLDPAWPVAPSSFRDAWGSGVGFSAGVLVRQSPTWVLGVRFGYQGFSTASRFGEMTLKSEMNLISAGPLARLQKQIGPITPFAEAQLGLLYRRRRRVSVDGGGQFVTDLSKQSGEAALTAQVGAGTLVRLSESLTLSLSYHLDAHRAGPPLTSHQSLRLGVVLRPEQLGITSEAPPTKEPGR